MVMESPTAPILWMQTPMMGISDGQEATDGTDPLDDDGDGDPIVMK